MMHKAVRQTGPPFAEKGINLAARKPDSIEKARKRAKADCIEESHDNESRGRIVAAPTNKNAVNPLTSSIMAITKGIAGMKGSRGEGK
jgi:hypothetical protein